MSSFLLDKNLVIELLNHRVCRYLNLLDGFSFPKWFYKLQPHLQCMKCPWMAPGACHDHIVVIICEMSSWP